MSKKTPVVKQQRSVKLFIVSFIAYSVVAVIIWPLLDLLLAAIFRYDFKYTWQDHIFQPIITMLLFTIIEFLTWNWWHKDTKK